MPDETLEKGLTTVNIEDELKQSYLDYAMSVIVGRALPDVRDGLKPVHRRVLFAMHGLKMDWNKPHKKSARIVGDVIGKYHPHGDKAVYDTIVRMAQDFAMRYQLVDGQGNFGSVDGDLPAAMRYTEVRLTKIAHTFLEDLDKKTVDFVANYDGSEQMPAVLPTRVPNLLINGTAGIAVGMATNIPTHNLSEVIDGCQAFIDNPDITTEELMEYIPAPDFPTGAFIYRGDGIAQAYRSGRGLVRMRARHEIETRRDDRQRIVVTEIPYRVNKAELLTKIAELVQAKKIEGIADLRDESNKDGMRIVIDLKREALPRLVVNLLFKHTPLESSFAINMVALANGRPRMFTLRSILDAFIKHRRDVVTRRTIYLLRQARQRGHILEGLALALARVDEVIALIKRSKSVADAKQALLKTDWQFTALTDVLQRAVAGACRPDELGPEYGFQGEGKVRIYKLSPQQAQAILDLRLQRLTSMERRKLDEEYTATLDRIQHLHAILKDPDKLRALIKQELDEVKQQFGDARRSEIIADRRNVSALDLIRPEDLAITLSRQGYIKAQPLVEFKTQRRGGHGVTAASVKDEDDIERLINANSHDLLLCISNLGRIYQVNVYEIPKLGRQARGKPIANLLPLGQAERIVACLPRARGQTQQHPLFIVLATKKGRVKRLLADSFLTIRSNGLIAIRLQHDEVIGALMTDGDTNLLLVSSAGLGLHCSERVFRPQGRAASGVRGMHLGEQHQLIALLNATAAEYLVTVSSTGYAKRTAIKAFTLRGRGGKGMLAMRMNERNKTLAGACGVNPGDELMFIMNGGRLIRVPADDISIQGRSASGVRVMRVAADGFIKSVAPILTATRQ